MFLEASISNRIKMAIKYSEVKQGILLLILFFLSFALYFTFFTLIPQLVGINLPDRYLVFVYAFASPLATLPLILFVSKKTKTQLDWRLSPPKLLSLVPIFLLVTALIIATNPLNNFRSYLSNLFDNKISFLSFTFPEFDLNLTTKLIGSVFLAPIIEEYFIRKQILGILLTKLSPVLSIILSSLFFALGHLKIYSIIYLFVWGLILGFIFYKTKSVELCMIIHALWNLAGLFLSEKLIEFKASQFILHIGLILISITVSYFILSKLVGKYSSSRN